VDLLDAADLRALEHDGTREVARHREEQALYAVFEVELPPVGPGAAVDEAVAARGVEEVVAGVAEQ